MCCSEELQCNNDVYELEKVKDAFARLHAHAHAALLMAMQAKGKNSADIPLGIESPSDGKKTAEFDHSYDVSDELHHPVFYAAAVMFEDGNIKTTTQTQSIEYPCSVDAVCKLQ